MKEKIKKISIVVLIILVIIFIGAIWIKEYNLRAKVHNLKVFEYCVELSSQMETPSKDFLDNCLEKFKATPIF